MLRETYIEYANNGPAVSAEIINGPLSVTTNISNEDHKISPFHFGVDSPDPKFTGRSYELNRLSDATINQNVPGHQSPIVVVCGLGGIGKTQLVRKFIDLNHMHYTYVIWINSEEYSSMLSQFAELATSYLKISTESNGKQKELKYLIGEVFHKLSTSPALIVLDNVDESKDNEIVKIILTMGTSTTRPHILITTRIQKWSYPIHCINLDVFNDGEAVEYVTTTLINPENVHNDSVNDKMKLVETFQFFPLTLAQGIAYINHCRGVGTFHIGDYLTEYKLSTERILDSRLFQNDDFNLYTSTTMTTWTVTKDAIKKNKASGDLALRILRIIAYCNPEHVHRYIFFNLKSPLGEQITDVEKEATSAISLLVKYSMVSSQKQESVLSIHRLVQQVTKIELDNDSDLKTTILRDGLHLISEMRDKTTFEECSEHGILLFREAINLVQLVHEYKTIPTAIIRSLNICQKYSRGRDFGDGILSQLTTILGEDDLDAINCKFVTANSYYNLGKINKALELYLEVYEKRKVLLEENHLDTLSCTMNIACTYYHLKRYSEALEIHQNVYVKRKKVLGERHQDTLVSMTNVGLTQIELGNFSEALQINQEAHEIQKIVLGNNHPDTIHSKAHIAYTYYRMGKFSVALKMYQEVYKAREIVLGQDHQQTLETKWDIANSLSKLGNFSEAIEMHQAVYEKQKIVLGEDHPHTLRTKASIDDLCPLLGSIDDLCPLLGGHSLNYTQENDTSVVLKKRMTWFRRFLQFFRRFPRLFRKK